MSFLSKKLACAITLLSAAAITHADSLRVYIGTYSRGDSEGIYTAMLDTETGEMSQPKLAAKAENPSFLAIHPSGKYLYCANEVGGPDGGSVSAFSIDRKTGLLTHLNSQHTGGGGPCHLVTDKKGSVVLSANYSGGSVAAMKIKPDGSLTKRTGFIQHTGGSNVNQRRQSAPHAHSINLDPSDTFAFVADLGLDQILVYKLDADKGTLTPNTPAHTATKPGGGPRHFALHPTRDLAFTNLELTSEITAMKFDPKKGTLKAGQVISTLPKDHKGNSTAEIHVHPNGKLVYCSNRGHNSIAVFSLNKKGRLKPVEHESTQGSTPRNFNLTPEGDWLIAANQKTGNITSFKVSSKTGQLEYTGHQIKVANPVCIRFLK